MAKQTYRPVRSEFLSLLSLRMVLTNAGKDLPPRALRSQKDENEELASKLIEKVKSKYKKPLSLQGWRRESGGPGFVERLEEMAGKDAG